MGTPAFMPPEQAGGEIDKLDERADVFGLGAILCVILTGQPPYVARHRRGDPADGRPRRAGRGVRPARRLRGGRRTGGVVQAVPVGRSGTPGRGTPGRWPRRWRRTWREWNSGHTGRNSSGPRRRRRRLRNASGTECSLPWLRACSGWLSWLAVGHGGCTISE